VDVRYSPFHPPGDLFHLLRPWRNRISLQQPRCLWASARFSGTSLFSPSWVGNPVELTSALLAAQKSHCYPALLLLVPGTDGVAAHTRDHPLMSAKELLGEEFERS